MRKRAQIIIAATAGIAVAAGISTLPAAPTGVPPGTVEKISISGVRVGMPLRRARAILESQGYTLSPLNSHNRPSKSDSLPAGMPKGIPYWQGLKVESKHPFKAYGGVLKFPSKIYSVFIYYDQTKLSPDPIIERVDFFVDGSTPQIYEDVYYPSSKSFLEGGYNPYYISSSYKHIHALTALMDDKCGNLYFEPFRVGERLASILSKPCASDYRINRSYVSVSLDNRIQHVTIIGR